MPSFSGMSLSTYEDLVLVDALTIAMQGGLHGKRQARVVGNITYNIESQRQSCLQAGVAHFRGGDGRVSGEKTIW